MEGGKGGKGAGLTFTESQQRREEKSEKNVPLQMKALPASAHPTIQNALHLLFNACWTQHTLPKAWSLHTMKLIHKPNKNTYDICNYRPIMLSPSITKLYESVLHTRLATHLNKNKLIPSYFGCNNGIGSELIALMISEHIHVHLETTKAKQKKQKPTCTCSLN